MQGPRSKRNLVAYTLKSMELRDYIAIFKKQEKVFWVIVLASALLSIVWQTSQPESLQATLLINIGRGGVQNTANYTYDSFYRLQADERFADTVVRWLATPRVVEDIYGTAGFNPETVSTRDLKGAFAAKRLSSQMIEVTYADASEKTLRNIGAAATLVLNRYAESLNVANKEPSWFVVIGSDPVIRDARIGFTLALSVGVALGIFIGFWAVLIRHYFFRE